MLPLASFFLHRLRAFVFRLHCRGVEQAACTSSRALSPALVVLMFALAARFRCCKGRRFRRSRGAVRLHECQRIAPCAAVASHTIMQPRHLRELSRMYRILFTRRRNVFSICQLGILTSRFSSRDVSNKKHAVSTACKERVGQESKSVMPKAGPTQLRQN